MAQPLHWITSYHPGDLSFCRNCAEKKISDLKKEQPEKEHILDGGWPTENDYPPTCATCGCGLDHIPLYEGENK
jgi:hypothetical protein